MVALACVLGLAAGLACDPDRATNPLRQTGARASLANPDSVSVVNLCGPRMSILNANDDSIAVVFYASTSEPPQALMLPRRPPGEPFSETFVFMTDPQYGATLGVGTRLIFMAGGPACAVRPVVPAMPAMTIDSATYVQGKAYWVSDPSRIRGIHSSRRLLIGFKDGTSQSIRQAVIDYIGGTVLGGQALFDDQATGSYYVEIPASPDSGLVAMLRILRTLGRNSAVEEAFPDSPLDIGPQGLAPTDAFGFTRWRFGTFDIADTAWHLEAINAPLAWGCETGNAGAKIALVDVGGVRASDVLPNLDALSSADSPSSIHAALMASTIAARGNNGQGLTGVAWAANLRYFNAGKFPPVASVFVRKSQRGQVMQAVLANALWAIAEGYRVINISLGINWIVTYGYSPTDTVADPHYSVVKNLRRRTKRFLVSVDSTIKKHGLPRPLIVLAAGNDGADAVWNGMTAVKGVLNPNSAADRARLDAILIVGATERSASMGTLLNHIAKSNHGGFLDVAAPGEDTWSLGPSDSLFRGEGTSQAAATVSGIAALLLSARPTLDGPALKEAILAGAAAGAYSTANPGGLTLKVVDAYQSLRQLATRPGGPLCGNRVWADANRILVKRDTVSTSTVGEAVVTAAKPIKSVSTYHGGRKLRAWYTDGTNDMFLLANGTWAAGVAPPESLQTSITGAAFSQFGYSHGGDTLLTTSITPNADSAAVLFRTFVPPDLLNPVSTATKSIVYLQPSDSLTCTYQVEDVPFGLVAPGNPSLVIAVGPRRMRNGQIGGPSVRCNGFTLNMMQPIARQVTAYSPTGRFAYVAINRQITRFVSPDANWVAWCDPAFAALNVGSWCRGGVMQQVPTGVTIARLNLATSVLDTVWNDAAANVHTLAVSENGAELAYTLSRDTVSWTLPPKFELQSQPVPWGRYDFVGYPVLRSSGRCYQAYLVLASNVTALRESASGCAAQPLALSTFSSVVASARSKESRSPHRGARR